MTSDAKIGLLLSLIFIFIIAFIINGLPNFFKGTDSNELTQTYLNKLRSYDSDITNGAREAVEAISNFEPVKKPEMSVDRRDEDGSVRLARPLSQIGPASSDSAAAKAAALPPPADSQTQAAHSAEPARPKIYVVQDDDSLALIAEKFYGPEEGGKKENVDRIFKANKDVLSSPDLIRVGQKLLIPPLRCLKEDPARADSGQRLFGKAKDLGPKSLSLASTIQTRSGRYREYVVREGDSLWQIAKEQLANPGRYIEIVRLNEDIIEDEDQLAVGMRIKLPNR